MVIRLPNFGKDLVKVNVQTFALLFLDYRILGFVARLRFS